MRIVDIFLAFPGLILALVIAGLLGPGMFNVMFALALVGWMGYARVVRGAVLAEVVGVLRQYLKTGRQGHGMSHLKPGGDKFHAQVYRRRGRKRHAPRR